MFNAESNELLEIKPVEDIACLDEEERPPTPPPTHGEIFEPKDVVLNVKEIEEKPELNGWGAEKKRGVGKRGKDKKKRIKKPPTAKQLAHLAKMRLKAAQKRTAIALEKKKKRQEIEKKMEKPTFNTPVKEAKVIKNAIIGKTHEYKNYPRAGKTTDKDFFALMERYESYKTAKNVKITEEKTLQERLMEQRKNKPHPNRKIPQLMRPPPPVHDPYADIFNYTGRL